MKQEKNLFDISATGSILSPSEAVTFSLSYDAQIGAHYSVQEASLNLDFKF